MLSQSPRECCRPPPTPLPCSPGSGRWRRSWRWVPGCLMGSQVPAPSPSLLTLFQDTEQQHSKVIKLYRSHLLYAVQVSWDMAMGDTATGDHCTMCAPVPRIQWWQQRIHRLPTDRAPECPFCPRATWMRTCRGCCARS